MKKCFSFIMALTMILLVGVAAFATDISSTTVNFATSGSATTNSDTYTYTGSPIEPGAVVTYNEATLKEGTDYTVSYPNPHTNVASEIPMVITGTGTSYSGTKTITYEIAPKDVAGDDVVVASISNQEYTEGTACTPTPTVTYNGHTLTSDEVSYTYKNNTSPGTATVVITGKGDNYIGSREETFLITTPSTLTLDGSSTEVTKGDKAVLKGTTYPGEGKITLTWYGTGHTINVTGNKFSAEFDTLGLTAGTTITVTFEPSLAGYENTTKDWTFTLVNTVSVPAAKTGLYYTGEKQTGVEAGVGYTITGNEQTDAGTYEATLTIADGYTWKGYDKEIKIQKVQWKIEGRDISECTVTFPSVTYTGSALEPTPTVTYNSKTLTLGTDYTVAYSNNINAGEATAVLTGKGNYSGTVTKTFTIKKAQIEVPKAQDFLWDGNNKITIAEGTGYTRSETYEATAVGTYTVKVAPKDSNYEWTDGTTETKTQTWKIVQPYTITFNGNGGSTPSPAERTTNINGVIAQMPSDPTYSGHTFLGWFTDPTGGNQITSATVFSANQTVYAHWRTDTTTYTVNIAKYSGYNLGRAYYRTSTSSSWIELSSNNVQTITATNGSVVYFRMVPYSGYYSHPYIYKLTSGGYYAVTPYNYEFTVTVTENLKVALNFSSAVPTGDSGVTQYLAAALVSLAAGTGILWFYRRKREQNT